MYLTGVIGDFQTDIIRYMSISLYQIFLKSTVNETAISGQTALKRYGQFLYSYIFRAIDYEGQIQIYIF